MQRSIKARLTITLICLLLGSALLQGLLQSLQIGSLFTRAAREQLFAQARQIAASMRQVASNTDRAAFVQELALAGGMRISLLNAAGQIYLDSDQVAATPTAEVSSQPEVETAWRQGSGWEVRFDEATQQTVLFVAWQDELPEGSAVIRLALPYETLQEANSSIWSMVGFGFLLIAVATFYVSIRLANDLIKPIQKVTEAAQKIVAGDLQQRITIERQDELGALVTSFNQLANTNRKRYQQIVAAKEEFETVIQNTVSGIFLLDAHGTVLLSNPSAGRTLGFDPQEDIPDHFCRLVNDASMRQALEEAMAQKQPLKQYVTISTPTKGVVELNVIPLVASDRFVVVFYDISEASRLAQIRADLITNVSHELKTPVTSIHGFAETILNGDLVTDADGRRFVKIIYRESRKLLRLVNDLLDLSRLELDPNVMDKRPVDLVRILKEVVERDTPLAAANQITLRLAVGVEEAILIGDEHRLSQAVDNLIGNAIKYTPPGGEVRVNLEYKANGFQIAVYDTGIGIEAEHLNRIFERFYRTDKARSRQNGGTGLGLSIVKHIVELHEGKVWVESKVGEGTAFYVHLPSQAGKQ